MEGMLTVRKPEDCTSVFYRSYEVIVDLVRIVFGFPDREHTRRVPYKVTARQAGAE